MKRIPALLVGLALASMNTPSHAQQYSPAADSAEFKAMAAAIDAGIRAELGQTVTVEELRTFC